jgi:hypothetical protein
MIDHKAGEDQVGNRFGFETFCDHRQMSLFVVLEARCEALGKLVALPQHGPLISSGLFFTTVYKDIQAGFQKDDAGVAVLLEERTGGFRFKGSAAQSEDDFALALQLGDDIGLHAAKRRFSDACEYSGDSRSCLELEMVIGIEEAPAKAFGKDWANSRFTGSHEADENDPDGSLRDGVLRRHTYWFEL